MAFVSVKVAEKATYSLVAFEITSEGGQIPIEQVGVATAEAVEIAPEVNNTKGVMISGRGPTHIFTALAHRYHAALFTANFEPRLNAGVVNSFPMVLNTRLAIWYLLKARPLAKV